MVENENEVPKEIIITPIAIPLVECITYDAPREAWLLQRKFSKELIDFFNDTKVFIAGGAITSIFSGKKINDYDIYFQTGSALNKAIKFFDKKHPANPEKEFEKVFSTNTAITYRQNNLTFQLVKHPVMFGLPMEVIQRFDYTVCMGAYCFEQKKFILHPDFLRHVAEKNLYFNIYSPYPLSALFRVRKYMHRGYKISGAEMIKLGLTINKLELKTLSQLKEHLQGIDTIFLKELTDELAKGENAEKTYDFIEFMEMLDSFIKSSYKLSKIFDEEEIEE